MAIHSTLMNVFVKINGKQHYQWRAVDQDGDVVDVYLQAKRDGVAYRELIPETIHSTQQYENNRAEQSHGATRVRERGMRKFKSQISQASSAFPWYSSCGFKSFQFGQASCSRSAISESEGECVRRVGKGSSLNKEARFLRSG